MAVAFGVAGSFAVAFEEVLAVFVGGAGAGVYLGGVLPGDGEGVRPIRRKIGPEMVSSEE